MPSLNLSYLNPTNEPKGKDWKHTNDGVMVADIGFKRQLWALDPELDVVWDYGKQKWEIWKFPGQPKKVQKIFDNKSRYVMTVQTKDRNFRELGADIILKLQAGDPTKYSLNELVAYFDKMDENIRRAKLKDLYNKINSVTMESLDYLRGVPKVQVPKRFQGGYLIDKGKKATSTIGGLVHV